jgi:serine/tyrosine/threonine adenylyltransferase
MADHAQHFHPEHAITEIADFIADPVAAAVFPAHVLRWRNDRAAAEIGLAALDDTAWIDHFGRFAPLAGAQPQPLALRYHGHQFRVYNPDIGDGRGFLFAQMRDHQGRLMDLGTKGSGTTPWSRFGDGRLTLKGGVREILATEMLEALGVETSRSFSLIETGEALHRGDEPSPTRAAVLVRLNHGHIRIGSFQRLAMLGLTAELERLVTYSLRYYCGEDCERGGAVRLLTHVARRTAIMAASFMAAGFVHGVLNSDNINITGESFDYGPWRFAPNFDPGFTAAYFDSAGLYAFGRQAEAIHWDVVQLAIALKPLADTDQLAAALDGFAPAYRAALVEKMLWRLGVASHGEEDDIALVAAIETALIASGAGIDRFFFDWAGGSLRTRHAAYEGDAFTSFQALVVQYQRTLLLDDPFWEGEPCTLSIENVEAIWAPIAERDDWSLFEDKIARIRGYGVALAKRERLVKGAV